MPYGFPAYGEGDYKGSTFSFYANPLSGKTNLSVTFYVRELLGYTVNSYSWDFGDGNTSTDSNPTHVYTKAGIYTVSLTLEYNSSFSTSTRYNYIHVLQGEKLDNIKTTNKSISFGLGTI